MPRWLIYGPPDALAVSKASLIPLTEFADLKDSQLAKSLSLVNVAEKLAGRPIWVSIGNNDERVDAGVYAGVARLEEADKHGIRRRRAPCDALAGSRMSHQRARWSRSVAIIRAANESFGLIEMKPPYERVVALRPDRDLPECISIDSRLNKFLFIKKGGIQFVSN